MRANDTCRALGVRQLCLSAGVLLALAGGTASAERGGAASPDGSRCHGVKLYLNQDDLQARYPDYDRLIRELRQGGVDALFTTVYEGKTAFYASQVLSGRNPAIDAVKLRHSARAGELTFGAICHVFFDAETLATRPDLVPVDQNGDGRFVNWQTLVCPSDAAYRAYKLDVVREVARTLRPDILSLDFMRFPTTWEIIPATARAQELRNFCFCERCLGAFQSASGVAIPAGLDTTPKKAAWVLREHGRAWEQWKTATITSFVAAASRAVREIDPGIRISVHVVPWLEQVFDRGLVRVAAGRGGAGAVRRSALADDLPQADRPAARGDPGVDCRAAAQVRAGDPAQHPGGADRSRRRARRRRVQDRPRGCPRLPLRRCSRLPVAGADARREGAGAAPAEKPHLR